MRRAWVFAALIGALVILPQVARATITNVYSTRTAGSGGNAGFDIVRWFVKFTPGSSEDATNGLLTCGVTMTADQPFKILTYNPGTGNTLDLTGENPVSRGNNGTTTPFNNNSTIGSFIAVRKYDAIFDPTANSGDGQNDQGIFNKAFSAINVSTSPGTQQPVSPFSAYTYTGTTPPTDPTKRITEFRVEGFNKDPSGSSNFPDPAAKSTDPNGARGALFAVAVVPTGATVTIKSAGFDSTHRNLLLYDAGGNPSLIADQSNPVPEPATFSIVGVGLLGLLARRSRKAA